MTFCTGCSHYHYSEHHTVVKYDSTIRGPGYFCDNPRVIAESSRSEDARTNIPIGDACGTCRGNHYNWDGITDKPTFILDIEASKDQMKQKVPSCMKVPVPKNPIKKRKSSRPGKKVVDPASKKHSRNRSL